MNDPVPAIVEATASGETAAIFADIRDVLGVGVVNLVWRHLATIPEALPWSWAILRPLYLDGTIGAEGAALNQGLDVPKLAAFPPEVLASAGLGEAARSSICDILAAYARTNAMAVTAFSALTSLLGEPSAAADNTAAIPALDAPFTKIGLPALPSLSDLSPEVAQLVLTLNRFGTRRPDPIVASMYRHLAYWPAYLALVWTAFAPLDADGRLERAIAAGVAKARARGEHIAIRLRPTADLPPAPSNCNEIRQALEPFTSDVIAKMAVICPMLREAMG